MYAEFDYIRPATLKELFSAMAGQGGETLLYAGGTDLLVLLRARKVSARHLIDIKAIPELNGITETDSHIRIGAAARFSDIENDPLVKEWVPSLAQAANQVGSVQIRFKGTLGGNIQTASPAGDGLNVAWGLDAEVGLLGRDGERRMALPEYITAPRKTKLPPGEVLSAVYIPKRKWAFQQFFKVGRRNALAISVVNGIVALDADGKGRITDARISVGAVAPTPIRIFGAEKLLIGKIPDAPLLNQIQETVRRSVKPISDIRASAQYRAYIAGVYVKRQITRFLEETK